MNAAGGAVGVADGVGDLSPEWLSRALDRDVRAVDAERIGTGQTGVAYRLRLDAEDEPATIVAKLAAGDAEARRRVRRGYRSEVGFYADLVATVDVRAPQCWYAAITDDGTSFTLLLEDLAPRLAGVQVEGCSPARAAAAVRNLAALHAPRWNDRSLVDLRFLTRTTEAGAEFTAGVMASATDLFVERFRGALDPSEVATLRDASSVVAPWLLARPDPFSVLHGDYRLDNLLFSAEGDDVVAVDWQTLAVGPPARDLAYLLGTSLLVEDRRAVEHDLVAIYHAALVERGVEGYGLDRCVDDYRLGQLQGPMVTTIGCAYATGARSPSADAMFLAMARRSCAAIRDLGSLDGVA